MSVDWQAVRRQFPALETWTYLNTATYGQMPARAAEAVAQHFQRRDELACSDFLDWFDDANRLRSKIARLIRCDAEDIAFVPNASAALAMLLGGLDWQPGDRVLTLEHEFPNNYYAPALLERFGVELKTSTWERLQESVDSRTRLVAISSVNYNSGFAADLAGLSSFLRARGVLLYVDGTQSIGALQFDASRIQPAMLAVHGYKWLLSPTGAGFCHVHPELRARLQPTVIGWRSHRDWRNVDNLHHGIPELPSSAEKYEGGSVAFALLYAMEASLDLMLEIGPEAIEKRVLHLARQTRDVLQRCGAAVEESCSQIIAARFENRDVSEIARKLAAHRVIVSARRGALRVSPHFYNDEQDLETLAGALSAVL